MRTDRRSRSFAPASSIMRYMAGTPTKALDRLDSMASRASVGRNLGSRYIRTPRAANMSMAPKPAMWAMGSPHTTSPLRMIRDTLRSEPALPSSACWVSCAPLGFPVVPDV